MKSIRTGYRPGRRPVPRSHPVRQGKAPEAGRKSDPNTARLHRYQAGERQTEFMNRSGVPANRKGGTYLGRRTRCRSTTASSRRVTKSHPRSRPHRRPRGHRGGDAWKGGKWTAVIACKLVTGGKDVQFDNLDGTYEFGLAAFDNAQAPRGALRRAEAEIREIAQPGFLRCGQRCRTRWPLLVVLCLWRALLLRAHCALQAHVGLAALGEAL